MDDNFHVDGQESLIFKVPLVQQFSSESSSGGLDLKWIETQKEKIDELYDNFHQDYKVFLENGKYPIELLKVHYELIVSLANYQILLQEQKNRRQNFIHSETSLQEMMQQIEGMIKNIRPE